MIKIICTENQEKALRQLLREVHYSDISCWNIECCDCPMQENDCLIIDKDKVEFIRTEKVEAMTTVPIPMAHSPETPQVGDTFVNNLGEEFVILSIDIKTERVKLYPIHRERRDK